MESKRAVSYLIVNADDYGYFDCVSKGILESVGKGIVTSTGVFANSNNLDQQLSWLRKEDSVDVGVHLNLTSGRPLTDVMAASLSKWGSEFPGKFSMAVAIMSGKIALSDVQTELRAQVRRCLEGGLVLRFLNSHEHIHMLPPLFPLIQELAAEFDIDHIRFSTPEMFHKLGPAAILRDSIMKVLEWINREKLTVPAANFLGMGESGKLSLAYLKRRLPNLKPGQVYELMCHPGRYDVNEVGDMRLLSYHAWEKELELLTSREVKDLCLTYRVELIGYRDLLVNEDRVLVRDGGVSHEL